MCQGASGKRRASQPSERPEVLIPRTLNECQLTQTAHLRTIRELVKCRSENLETFFSTLCNSLRPIFLIQEKEPSVERVVKYVSAFAAYRDEEHAEDCNSFVEDFLKHLLDFVDAANKTVRYRTCQMIAEVMTRLVDDVELSDELWEELIGSMQTRMEDKVPAVRVNAARALARLVSGDENDSTVAVYRQALEADRSADVRKMVILSIPLINSTIPQIFEHTMDVSDGVRRAAFSVLGSKLPINTLSIMQRAKILQRGLSDRVPAVQAECLNMLKTTWLDRDCDGDVISLLRYLDVETNEKVGESVLDVLLKHDIVKASVGEGLRQFLLPLAADNAENEEFEAQLMAPEQALYWRIISTNLHAQAQAKGNEAANTGGAQSVLNAATAANVNEVLDSVLPPTVASYVELVKVHLNAGPKHRFAVRQLVMLATVLDFTDGANRKVAGILVKTLLLAEAPDSQQEADLEINPEVFVGDGLSLGGDHEWAAAVSEFAGKVYSEQGEYGKVLAEAISRLGQPCRDGGAEPSQWLHCLAVTSLLLEKIMSLRQLAGCAIESQEIVDALLIPAVKHVHPEVQIAGIRCLGLFGQLATKPSSLLVRHLRLSVSSGNSSVQSMAVKALFDLILCHGATMLDRAVGIDPDLGLVPEPCPLGIQIPVEIAAFGVEGDMAIAMRKPLLELLVSLLDSGTIYEEMGEDCHEEIETPRSLVAEGFAKLLLQSKLFKEIQAIEIQAVILAKLLRLYFNDDLEISPRLQQCLSVFFNNYSVLSAENKKCVAKAFIPVMRAEWPGIYGNRGIAAAMISAKKRATQLSRFMLQLLQNPLLAAPQQIDGAIDISSPDLGHESLAINLALEVKRFKGNSSTSAKAYVLAMARIAAALEFRPTAQEEIKCMLHLLDPMMEVVAGDKLLLKDLKEVHDYLISINNTPEETLSDEQLQTLLDKCGVDFPAGDYEDEEEDVTPAAKPRKTPKKQTTTKNTKKPAAVAESPVAVGVTRSQRKGKSEALRRLSMPAAKQRVVDSDDSAEESMEDVPGNTSEIDEDEGAGPEMLASNPNSSFHAEPAVDRMSHSPSATEKSAPKDEVSSIEPDNNDDDEGTEDFEPVRSRPSTRAARGVETASKKTTKKKTVSKSKGDVPVSVRPRTRRQISESSAVSSQLLSNATDDDADSANTEGASSQPIVIEGSDSDPEFQRVPEKKEKKVAPPAAKRPTTRGRTAWK